MKCGHAWGSSYLNVGPKLIHINFVSIVPGKHTKDKDERNRGSVTRRQISKVFPCLLSLQGWAGLTWPQGVAHRWSHRESGITPFSKNASPWCHIQLRKNESRNIVRPDFEGLWFPNLGGGGFSSNICLRSKSPEADSETRLLRKMIYEEMSPARARKKVGKGQKPRQGAILSQALPNGTLA